MAFCPNCGTSNTEQAENCVSCGFELAPKQKAKFKGTIMMSGVKVPGGSPGATPAGSNEPGQPPASPAAPAAGTTPPAQTPSTPSSQPPERNLAFQKTMVGHAGLVPPPSPQAQPKVAAPPAGPQDLAHAPTMQGHGPNVSQGATKASPIGAGARLGQPSPPSFSTGGTSTTAAGAFTAATSSATIDSTFPGAPSKPNPGKLLAIGCGAALLLACVLSGLVWSMIGSRIKSAFGGGGDDSGAEAAAWQQSIAQSLTQVATLCRSDCEQAGVFFHANVRSSLMDEAKALSDERIEKLSNPASSKAQMLSGTEDEEIATKLGLDPQQCARVVAGAGKVVSCSVPEPGGKPSVLRIVHLSGMKSL